MARKLPEGWNLMRERGAVTISHKSFGLTFSKNIDDHTFDGKLRNMMIDFFEAFINEEQNTSDQNGFEFSEEKVRSLFIMADIKVTKVWELRNQYWPESVRYDDIRSPWWLVRTSIGLIVVGWRKRVLEIDWSDTKFYDVVTEDDVTKSNTMVHAYSYVKAVEYLTKLRLLSGAETIGLVR